MAKPKDVFENIISDMVSEQKNVDQYARLVDVKSKFLESSDCYCPNVTQPREQRYQ